MQAALTPAVALGAKAGASLLGGIDAFASAQSEKRAAEVNAYIGRTRAMQTDVAAREGLSSELGQMRAALGANQQRANVGTLAVFDELRTARDRERRVEFGNRMQEVADFRTMGRNAGAQGAMGLAMGVAGAGSSLFDLYQLRG